MNGTFNPPPILLDGPKIRRNGKRFPVIYWGVVLVLWMVLQAMSWRLGLNLAFADGADYTLEGLQDPRGWPLGAWTMGNEDGIYYVEKYSPGGVHIGSIAPASRCPHLFVNFPSLAFNLLFAAALAYAVLRAVRWMDGVMRDG
jgi:hypothetical protein